jgi:serine/threonine protein kinase
MADSAAPRTPGNRPPRPDPKPGEPRRVVRMGKYEVIQHIATGGMGAVYRARDTESGKEVALKILMPELAARPAMLERFRREARSADKLDHENIVRQFEFGEINGKYFLAMEFVDGVDLHDYVKEKGPLDPEEARFIILQGARALRYSHGQNIVHRDIKPSNFLLTQKNKRSLVKLADFGLARELDADERRVTLAGTTVGTVDYMSPEQAKDSSAADIRSDLYSLGSTWYHLLAGHAPFNQGGLGERLIKIMHEEPPDIREINPRVSAECWEILQRLLAKEARDRYQTPAELIDELLTLEGRTTAIVEARPKKAVKKKTSKKKQSTQHDSPKTVAEDSNRTLWYALGGVGAAVLLAVIVLLFTGRRPPPGDQSSAATPVAGDPGVTDPLVPLASEKDKEKGKGKEEVKVEPIVTIVPNVKALPWLTTTVKAVDAKALREEIVKPWAEAAPIAADAVVLKVSRATAPSATSFRSLAEACAKATAGKPVVIEIADNGPLFERSPGRMEGRDVVVRAGKGYRPLVVWDLPATLLAQPGKADQPLVFLGVSKGRLFVEGIEFAWRWPDTLERPAILFDAQDSDLSVSDCAISAGGKPKKGITLSRFHGEREGGLCRLTRCQMRGANVVGLDLDAPAAEVLLDGCLLCGGDRPLLRVRASAKAPKVRIARSTLVGGTTMLELTPATADKAPPLAWLGWDSLFSRCAVTAGGALVALTGGFETRATEWRSVNCLYAGWADLLSGTTTVAADLADWQKHWARIEIDRVALAPWPDLVFLDPSKEPASSYAPGGAVRFASTVAVEQPLGCDLPALPAARDGWMALAYDPTLASPDLPSDDDTPPIPQIADGKFHGAAVNLDETDLGDYLTRLQARTKLGPKVVLHLSGKGERPTSPIRIKGSSLILHFEEPADKTTPRLGLVFTRSAKPVPLLDVEDGNVDVIGGFLRVPDTSSLRVSHVVRVTRGDVRLYKTRLEGPQQSVPEGFVAALSITGSGDPNPEKGHTCAINECAIFSSQVGVSMTGVGCRLAMRQSVVVAGTEGLEIQPGNACKGHAGISCSLVTSTFASRRAVLRLGDAPNAGLPSEPVVINARECAYLNPFPGKPSKAGLVVWEGDALARGLLLWQGEREGYDTRLHFAAADNSQAIPEAKDGLASWKTLWGSAGVRRPRDLTTRDLGGLFEARRWVFERLILKRTNPPGANIERLGLVQKRKG